MRAARAWGVPLSVLRLERTPGERWTDTDAKLAQALLTYEAALCPNCGQDRHESMDIESDGEWVVEEMRCHSCTAIGRAAKKFENAEVPSALSLAAERRQRLTPEQVAARGSAG